MKTTSNKEKRIQRHKRIRSQVKGTAVRPRLSVFRSNRYVWAQLIDDEHGHTLAAACTRESAPVSKSQKSKAGERTAAAASAGEKIAGMAAVKKILTVVFDRGGYRYHGIIKAVAEGARKGGLKF
jgi:large subunit ribosomal protein L18